MSVCSLVSVSSEGYVYRGRKFSVRVFSARLPDGRRVVKEAVVYPGAVLIIPVLRDGRIVLVRQYRPVVGRWLYELPAGTLEPGEDPEECARRELEEETGYRAEEIFKVFEAFVAPGYSTEKIHVYVARVGARGRQRLDVGEVISGVEAKGIDELVGMVGRGEIEDLKTIAAIMYYKGFLEGGQILGEDPGDPLHDGAV